MDDEISPWDSDHTALVHVLWKAQHEGKLPNPINCDELASFIMQSKWHRAVKQHAIEGHRERVKRERIEREPQHGYRGDT